MPESAVYLFVYGTLRRDLGHAMHRVLARQARYLGPGRVAGRLYDLGRYPALVRGADAWVWGELYALPAAEATLRELDRYEGCDPATPPPHEYRREQVPVLRPSGAAARAWAYVYNLPRPRGTWIRSGDYARR